MPIFSRYGKKKIVSVPKEPADDYYDAENIPEDFKYGNFKGVKDECRHRALTLTLKECPEYLERKYEESLTIGIKVTKKKPPRPALSGNNFDRLANTLEIVMGFLRKVAKKASFVFELGQEGNLHYHVYLKLKKKSNYILLYRDQLSRWKKNFGFIKDAPCRSEKGQKVWQGLYLQKEWLETQKYFFGEVKCEVPLALAEFGSFFRWFFDKQIKLKERYESFTDCEFTYTKSELAEQHKFDTKYVKSRSKKKSVSSKSRSSSSDSEFESNPNITLE